MLIIVSYAAKKSKITNPCTAATGMNVGVWVSLWSRAFAQESVKTKYSGHSIENTGGKMKVFEVMCEYPKAKEESNEIVTERIYVTTADDQLRTVAEYYARHCHEYEKELLSVTEVFTVAHRIMKADLEVLSMPYPYHGEE